MPRIVVLGDRNDRLLAHQEIDGTLALFPPGIDGGWVATGSASARNLGGTDGVWLVSGGPYSDSEAVLGAIDYCIDTATPFLGICMGFQYACLALVRRHGMHAVHAELDSVASNPVIAPLACSIHGEQRRVLPVAGTRLSSICGPEPFLAYHNCGFGLAPKHEKTIEGAGAVISAHGDDVGVAAIELPGQIFFLATAFHPQVGVRETGRLHPLLQAFLDHASTRSGVPSN